MTTSSVPCLDAQGLSKRYGPAWVVSDVDLSINAGEVHGLVGANGAGKSTFIKMLTGVVLPDRGSVVIDGRPVRPGHPADSLAAGLACIYQDDQLVPELTVLDNLILGRYQTAGLGLVPRKRALRETTAQARSLGFELPFKAKVSALSPVLRKEVEIVRALIQDARVLLLDEPTAALPYSDVQRLFEVIRAARAAGAGALFVSHVLEEVLSISDRVTVLRNGTAVASTQANALTKQALVGLMFAGGLSEVSVVSERSFGPALLEVEHLSRPPVLRDVSFTVREGETVVLAGLAGSGRSEVLRAIHGVEPAVSGRVRVRGRELRHPNPGASVNMGIGYVPADRMSEGLLGVRPIYENVSAAALRRVSRLGWLHRANERTLADQYSRELGIVPPDTSAQVASLSGGNQQKVLMARWFAAQTGVLLLDEPTAGIDVRTKAEILRLIQESVAAGAGALVVTSDIEEVLAWGDTVLVMGEGRIVAQLPRSEATRERVLRAIGGQA